MDHNAELKQFLRSRRAKLRPEDAGLPQQPGRRVPGLRREELAALAGVSVDYYVRLEQGRNLNPSEAVVDAIARALRLDDAERDHLFDLSRARRGRRPAAMRAQQVPPTVFRLLESLDAAATPAFVVGRRMDYLAVNRMARALICDFNALPAQDRNNVRFMFLDPYARELYPDWASVASETVAVLRSYAGRHPDDPALTALVGELSVKCDDFRRRWADHEVHVRTSGSKRYRHPVVGTLTIDYQALQLPEDAEQTLFVYTASPGSESAEALRLLASWTDMTQPASAPLRENAP
ncbi:helix-turn-helix transcriptional regulator [Winogradskya humida]|uniref:Transcriptional regulator n=1 Tax=Winogradskya humida TaxID=113566 RepID=A0ABQ4A6L5_9ACTN|nr:helix-turn-helix transcriptional regulator [Actinoplanes humidus]GIE26500.1 transcriptional regulator [Actinoplanes humidus]